MRIDGRTTKEILNTLQAAEHIGVGKSTMEKWRMRDTGPIWVELSPGRGRVGYRVEDLDAWIMSRLREPGTKPKAATAEGELETA